MTFCQQNVSLIEAAFSTQEIPPNMYVCMYIKTCMYMIKGIEVYV